MQFLPNIIADAQRQLPNIGSDDNILYSAHLHSDADQLPHTNSNDDLSGAGEAPARTEHRQNHNDNAAFPDDTPPVQDISNEVKHNKAEFVEKSATRVNQRLPAQSPSEKSASDKKGPDLTHGTADHTAVRDASGDLKSDQLHGQPIKAKSADLPESRVREQTASPAIDSKLADNDTPDNRDGHRKNVLLHPNTNNQHRTEKVNQKKKFSNTKAMETTAGKGGSNRISSSEFIQSEGQSKPTQLDQGARSKVQEPVRNHTAIESQVAKPKDAQRPIQPSAKPSAPVKVSAQLHIGQVNVVIEATNKPRHQPLDTAQQGTQSSDRLFLRSL